MTISSDADQKVTRLLTTLMKTEGGRDLVSRSLLGAGFKVFPRVEFMSIPEVADPGRRNNARTGVILDVETTGFEPKQDKVIQLSMQKVSYDEQGIIAIGEMFDRHRDPGIPIPEEITRLTGITDDMVQGQTITDSEVKAFLDGVDLVVAHHAGFDRKFVEEHFPEAGFDALAWHCSVEQVDWKARGASDAKLEGLARFCGFTYEAHNSRSDILATAFILMHRSEDGPSAFEEMYARGVAGPMQIIAQGSGYTMKDDLKANGYRWCPADESVGAYSKVWHKTIEGSDEAVAKEARFLEDLFGRSVILPALRHTPETRYSARAGQVEIKFCTSTRRTAADHLKAQQDEPGFDFSALPIRP